MSIIGKTTRLAYIFTQTVDIGRPSLHILDRKISDFSKANMDKTMKKPSILSLEEFKKQKFQSLESYIKEKEAEYPNKPRELFEEWHKDICSSMYQSYKRAKENPGSNPALMLQSDFFEDEKKS